MRSVTALLSHWGLTPYDASVLAADRTSADFYEKVADGRDGKLAANWVINELFGRLNKEGLEISTSPVSAEQLGGIVDLISKGDISGKIAKDLFEIVWTEGGEPAKIVEERGMKQVTDTGAIEKMVDEIVAANPDQVEKAPEEPEIDGLVCGPGDESLTRQSQSAGCERNSEVEIGPLVPWSRI